MTVKELYERTRARSILRVKDGGTGRVLCYSYKPDEPKHEKIGKMEIYYLWADIEVTDSGFGHYAQPYLCVYAAARGKDEEDETD